MGPHGILDAGVGIVGVVHRDVTVAVAQMGGGNGGLGRIRRVDRGAAVVLVVFICWRRRLTRVVPGDLGAAVVSSRGAGRGRVGVRLPLLVIHGMSGRRGGEEKKKERRGEEEEERDGCRQGSRCCWRIESDEWQRQRQSSDERRRGGSDVVMIV